ncbi:MAG: aminotransferase class I/II-fold pyridoxal phosphate-dependent enzyme [archaeon]|nr:aminotransferase class I/II-fold pyridoxal phosphate-dependent enzyme [Nanoarchaeota archaeon]
MPDHKLKQAIIQSIGEKTKHYFVELVTKGNSAILLALTKLSLANPESKIYGPKEGGWLTYPKYAKALGKEYITIETTDATLNLDDLQAKLSAAPPKSIFIYHSLGGYVAKQPIEQIYNICKERDCHVVMDACGSFGTNLCDGNYADVMFGSFGRWKLVDLGRGAFISFKDQELYEQFKPLVSAFPFEGSDEDYEKLLHKLDSVEERINFLLDKRKEIIEFLDTFDIVHKTSKLGFVVIVKFKNETDRMRILKYCTTHSLEYTDCPREIRILDNAISIEVKRLSSDR